MHQSFYVALGGSIGALSRHYLVKWIGTLGFSFPLGTLSVNIIGSFIIGLLFESSQKLAISTIISPLIFIGFLGSLTTFSAFSLQTMQFIKSGQLNIAALNIASQLISGLLATFIGMQIAHYLWR
jgi:CrcB protein